MEHRTAPRPTSARRQKLEMLLGILGFFTFVAFVVAAVTEVRGRPAGEEVVVLVVFLAATYAAYVAWRRS